MSRLPLVLAALALAGCGGAERETIPTAPAWLGNEYSDGTVRFSYPDWWERSTNETFGALLADNRSRHPAFVSVRYLDTALPATSERYATLASRTIRPPAGRGLTLLYTQAARLGRVRGFEAAFMWATRADTPIGPTMRTFGVQLPSGRTALLVFAAERPKFHGGMFGWIRKTIRWTDGAAGGRVVNEP